MATSPTCPITLQPCEDFRCAQGCRRPGTTHCGWFWGSHGCDLVVRHKGVCECKDCSQFDHATSRVRYLYLDGTWSEWLDSVAFR